MVHIPIRKVNVEKENKTDEGRLMITHKGGRGEGGKEKVGSRGLR